MKKPILVGILLLAAAVTMNAQNTDFPKRSGPYLGQKPSGMTPEVFAPEIIVDAPHSVAVFSPDGHEVYWVPWSTLKMQTMKEVDGIWQKPQNVPFAVEYDAENPSFSADGSKMYFTSTRPLGIKDLKAKRKFWNENIWYVDRKQYGWSEPVPLGPEVNALDLHWQFSIDDHNSDLYFSASSGESGGESDIYRTIFIAGRYSHPLKLSEAINTDGDEDTPFVGSDGSYLIFARKPGASTMADLYVSFKNADGSWREAVNMGAGINSSAHEVCPLVTRDGKYLFFVSMRSGKPRIYWISASIIDELKPKSIKRIP